MLVVIARSTSRICHFWLQIVVLHVHALPIGHLLTVLRLLHNLLQVWLRYSNLSLVALAFNFETIAFVFKLWRRCQTLVNDVALISAKLGSLDLVFEVRLIRIWLVEELTLFCVSCLLWRVCCFFFFAVACFLHRFFVSWGMLRNHLDHWMVLNLLFLRKLVLSRHHTLNTKHNLPCYFLFIVLNHVPLSTWFFLAYQAV